jgi:hypothetical protein
VPPVAPNQEVPKNQNKKNPNPPPLRGVDEGEESTRTEDPAPTGGSILKDWIDHCTAHGVKLTPTLIKRYGAGCKRLLDAHFTEIEIKKALAAMLEAGKQGYPAAIDSYLARKPGAAPGRTAYPSAAERADEARRRQGAIARAADRIMADQKIGPTDSVGVDRAWAAATQIVDNELAKRRDSGYSDLSAITAQYSEQAPLEVGDDTRRGTEGAGPDRSVRPAHVA